MHQIRKHRRRVIQEPLSFEETAYTTLRWLYGQAIKENDFQMEHALGLLLMGLKQGIVGSLVVGMIEQLEKVDSEHGTERFKHFTATLHQIDSEILVGEGLLAEDVRM